MGVTTAVGGNCGDNACHPADYLDIVDRDGAAVNVAMLAGHTFFRQQAGCTDKYAPASDAQIAQMAGEIGKSLARGCLGVSYGIRYVPGMDARELRLTAAPCKRDGRLVAAHIRSDAEEVFDAAREFLNAGMELGVPMQKKQFSIACCAWASPPQSAETAAIMRVIPRTIWISWIGTARR